MRRRYQPKVNHNSEFELDLAPLLAVMVKLVPVLLVSSAFVQLMIVESELPQVIQQALAKQESQKSKTVSLHFDKTIGVEIQIVQNGKGSRELIALTAEKSFDYGKVHDRLQEIKKTIPEIFKIEFHPGKDVSYKEIVEMMDEVRKSSSVMFSIKNEKTGQTENTNYMFPEVVFNNIFEG